MTRDQLLALLARQIADGSLTEAQAHRLLDAYDAGDLPDLAAPLPPAEAIAGLDSELWERAGEQLARFMRGEPVRWG